MKCQRLFISLIGILWLVGWLRIPTAAQTTTPDSSRPLLLAHYMPWYQTPEVSGYWGWHWTMDHFDPAQTDANGRPQIASHYFPLTGPYDSSDDDVLEYQTLLMKLSGIDGVIVDWYGMDDFRDYQVLNASTNKLFSHIQQAELSFIICYEDQSIKHMVEDGTIQQSDAHQRGQDVMNYLQATWFEDDAYVKVAGQPVLFTYGPQYFQTPDDWETLFSGLEVAPLLVTLDKRMDWAAFSSYPWPPMYMSGGIELGQKVLENYLKLFYRNAARRDYIVGSAWPGFHDIYAEAGVRSSYGSIAAREGETLQYTLDLALENNASLIQLVTWNDYGEGTTIEPAEEYGYRYLEIVQEARRKISDGDFTFTAEDLKLPLRLFNLRKAYAEDAEVKADLDRAAAAIFTGDTVGAAAILSSYP